MEQAKRLAPKSRYEETGKTGYPIHSLHYVHKPTKREEFYQHGTAPIDIKTGAEMEKENGKEQPSNERKKGKPVTYMGKPGEFGNGVVYHPLPTKQSSHNLRVAHKEGNVVYLKDWHKHSSDVDPTEQPFENPIRYEGWRRVGEDNYPSMFTQNRGYELPHVKIGNVRELAFGSIKDTPLKMLKVQDITPAANMDYSLVGSAISKATVIEPSFEHHARAKKFKYALAANDGAETLEEKVEKHSDEGIGHKAGEAAAEIADFAGFALQHIH